MKEIKNLKLKIKNLVLHPLFTGSAIMIVGSNLANFFAYLFHLIIGRMLGPSGYGELAAVLSLVGLLSITFGFLGLVIVKFVAEMKPKEASGFFVWINRRVLIVALVISLAVFFASGYLSRFLNISLSSAMLASPLVLVLFISFIYTSFLQGLLRFGRLVVSTDVGLLLRLLLGVLFVYLGLSVFGSLVGVFFSSAIGLVVALYFLKDLWHDKKEQFKFEKSKEVFSYAVPIFVMSMGANSMYMSDVILTKHFFDPHLAGIYASLSTMGKIIFYGTAPVAAVMFPLVSKTFAKGGNYKKVFWLSFLLTSAMVAALVLIYWLLPNLVLNILFGSRFLEGAPDLVWFGIFIGLFALSSLVLNYFLSKGTTKVVYMGLFAAIAQILGISLFHKDILQVVSVSIWVSLTLLALLLIYFWYETRFDRNSGLRGGKDNK